MTVTISGLGAWPGEDPLAAHQAILGTLAEAPAGIDGLPHLAVLPARGPWAAPIGRTLSMLEALPASLEPHGWRLSGAPSAELVRAGRVLADDVESFALAGAGYEGPVAAPVLGPFSLAASLWLPVGERVIDDAEATSDVGESLGVGVARHLEAIAAAVSGTRAAATALKQGDRQQDAAAEAGVGTVLLHEPLLADVLTGRVRTFVGSGRLRPPEVERVTAQLALLVAAWAPHRCVVVVPPDAGAITAAASARPHALALDVTALDRPGWEALAETVERGGRVWATSVPHRSAEVRPDAGAAARGVLDRWRSLGLATTDLSLTLTARPGLGTLSPEAAGLTLRDTAEAALAMAEQLA